MTTYSSSLTFATEAGVERYAVYDFTSSTTPTEDQVYEYAKDISSVITMATEKAGSKIAPPHTSDATGLSRLLQQANEIGAAFRAHAHMYRFNRDDASLGAMTSLAAEWSAMMGADSVGSVGNVPFIMAGSGTTGQIPEAIASATNSQVIRSDISEGLVSFGDTGDAPEIVYPFRMEDVD